jgi:hemoglobin-like flavoprotein
MKSEQIMLVKTTWMRVVPIKDKAAELFYGKLFELDPSLKPLFKGDISEQGKKLMMTISTVVNSLEKLETLLPVVQDLGRRHVKYGVKDKHYDTVAAALLWTLGAGLGDAFTPDVKAAWTEAYTVLATVMKEAAAEEAVA